MCSCSARDAGRLMGWIAAELRYVSVAAIGKSARTEGGNTSPGAEADEREARGAAASAAALKRNCRRSIAMIHLHELRYLPQRPFRKRPLERRRHALLRELALAAQEIDDARKVRLAECDVVAGRDLGFQVNAPDGVDVAKRPLNLVGHALDPSVLLNQLQRLFGSDAVYTIVEIGPHQNPEVDEPLAVDAPRLEKPIELDQL